jgi:hypothetical protein
MAMDGVVCSSDEEEENAGFLRENYSKNATYRKIKLRRILRI